MEGVGLEPTHRGERTHALVGTVRSGPQGRRVRHSSQTRYCRPTPRQPLVANTLLQAAFVAVELANRLDKIAPMTVFGRTLRSFRVASFEPRPNALIVSMGETLGKIVGLFVQPGKECTDRLLVSFAHNNNDGPGPLNKQAWPCPRTPGWRHRAQVSQMLRRQFDAFRQSSRRRCCSGLRTGQTSVLVMPSRKPI
jgi:hypothetical protein